MSDAPEGDIEVVENAFLNGRVRLRQPRHGYRAATDPVLLAAGTPAQAGDLVLELGCGVGAAALCLAARVPRLKIHGVELQADYAELAAENAAINRAAFDVHRADIRAMPEALKEMTFDCVIMNPPYHDAYSVGSPDMRKDRANRLDIHLEIWLTSGLTRLRQGGWITIIQRVEWLPEILRALSYRTGDITVLPLIAREGRDAKRVIVKARKASRGAFRLAAPLALHDGSTHVEDKDTYSERAKAILRDGRALEF